MTEAGKASNIPIDIPAGLVPRWERRYRGRLRYELDALVSGGIAPDVDIDALKAGRLDLTFDWPLDGDTNIRLRAVYPDSFPHMRPQVFLRSGLDPPPVRHCSPNAGNLCLLGRDSRQWIPSWTLYKLLSEQVADAIRDSGDEDPQGEPAEYWWNQSGPKGAYCLIDSDWTLGGASEGTLVLRLALVKTLTYSSGDKRACVPILRAVVTQVRDAQKNVLHDWQGPFPQGLAEGAKLTVPWVRLDETIFPNSDIGIQAATLRNNHVRLGRSQPQKIGANLTIDLFAISHPTETGFGEIGIGWIFFLCFGHPNAFQVKQRRNKANRRIPSPSMVVLPTLRAGANDIGHRVPAVEVLRQRQVLVVGTGAVGAPVAVELARSGCGTLHLIEYDVVEPGNTVRWPLGATAWGCYKLDALATFLEREYPGTSVHRHLHCFGQAGPTEDGGGDDDVLAPVISEVDLVVDGSASHGVTALLADRCREANIPLITLFATPTVEGGAVVRHVSGSGCPNCLEHAWHNNEIQPPPGRGSEDGLTQPPGCAERTFIGSGYDLQELSLQAVRLVVETLSGEAADSSVVQTLSFVDEEGRRCPPRWRVDPLHKHRACRCQG